MTTVSKTKTSFIVACGLALAALPCAFAAPTNDPAADAMFKAMDTSGDGKVSRAEHTASAQKMFTDADTSHDGVISLPEMESHRSKMKADKPMKADKMGKEEMSAGEMFKMCDKDEDGQVSEAEHAAHADKMFTKMDTDSDGSLSSTECSVGQEKMMKNKKSAK